MTMRGPAAHLYRAPGWRRSGDESHWESLMSEGEVVHCASRTPRAPRPQSAIEGGQMDSWQQQQLERIQNGHFRAPSVHDQVPFNDRTVSTPTLNKEGPGSALRQQGTPSSYSGDLSSSGSPSLCDRTFGSQESLQAGISNAPERRGSWERAHFRQAPGKEQATVGCLTPVKMGWLPIQRRVIASDAPRQNQYLDHSTGQVKLKQPITPTIQKAPVKTNGFRYLVDGEVERSHSIPHTMGVRTWQAPDQASHCADQVPDKLSSAPGEDDTPLSWQALRRGWTINRASPLCGETQPYDLTTGTNSDPNRKTPPIKTNPLYKTARTETYKSHSPPNRTISTEPFKSHTPLNRTTSTEPLNSYSPPNRTTSVEPFNSHTPLNRTTSVEPFNSHSLLNRVSSVGLFKSDAPLHSTTRDEPFKPHTPLWRTTSIRTAVPLKRRQSVPQPSSHIATSSSVATLVPQNKACFSSITISSRKVSRSASLPSSSNPRPSPSDQDRASPSPPLTHHSTDLNLAMLERKATVVKVTEHRMTANPWSSVNGIEREPSYCHPPSDQGSDTVVHRRKATIIKVTEHRESYSPAQGGSKTRNPDYRHSYTEGVYRENSLWQREPPDPSEHNVTPSYHQLETEERTNYTPTPSPSTSVVLRDPAERGRIVHRSTLSLFVSNSPAITAPPSSDLSATAVGERPGRPQRPASCYGNVFGHTEPSTTRIWSFELPDETRCIDPANTASGFISPKTVGKETGQSVAKPPTANGDGNERVLLSQDASRRPSLTLIKAPDSNSHQSAEEVLALNAAAIIANIKLQRQLSKKRKSNGVTNEEFVASPPGNSVMDDGKYEKPHNDLSAVRHWLDDNAAHLSSPHAEFVPLGHDSESEKRPVKTISLREALEKSKPDFISRSQDRLGELKRRMLERRMMADTLDPQADVTLGHKRGHCTRPTSLSDNLFKPRDRAITGKEMHLRSKRNYNNLPEVKKRKEEEKKREVCLANRQRAEIFKKKLLDQVLQRGND